MKKILTICTIFTCCILLLSSCGETFTPYKVTNNGFTALVQKDETAILIDYTGDEEKCEIPSTIEGHSITNIAADAFEGSTAQLHEVYIPESILKIENNPFVHCNGLTSITISPYQENYMIIDKCLVEKATEKLVCYPHGLKEETVIIPNTIQIIGSQAFRGNQSIKQIDIPDSITIIEEKAFDLCDLRQLTIPKNVNQIGSEAFANNGLLGNIEIESSIEKIANRTFADCYCLKIVKLPDSIKEIDTEAFAGCRLLDELKLPPYLKVLGKSAFKDCAAITEMILPETIETIIGNPFVGCKKLSKITISPYHETYETYDNVLFNKKEKKLICYAAGKSETTYSIPKGTKATEDYAFYNADKIAEITIPEDFDTLGIGTFENCDSLMTIHYPQSLTTISENAFANCNNLYMTNVPDNIKVIRKKAFYHCNKLASITIPQTVETIEDDAFSNCTNLKMITLYASIKECSRHICQDCPNITVKVLNDTYYRLFTDGHIKYCYYEGVKPVY